MGFCPVGGIIRSVIQRQPDPRRWSVGSSSPCWPRESIPTTSWPSSRSSRRTARRRADRRARPAPRPAGPADLRRQGQARGAEARLRRVRAPRCSLVDDELDAGPAAVARERTPGARRRPHAADPRHLRPARAQRRGQAPGRARAARVQPPAHARHVAAPRAPRRLALGRESGPRARRVAARDRPPHRAPPDHAPAQAAEGPRASSATCAARSVSARRRRRSRSPGYTNVGKSTLLNALTGADVSRRRPAVRDARPDDALVRARRAALSRHRHGRLHPPAARRSSCEGFAATLEETLVADLVLHVVDASAPDERLDEQDARRRGRAARDRRRRAAARGGPEQDRRRRRAAAAGGSRTAFPDAVQISALDRRGARRAARAHRGALRRPLRGRASCFVPYEEGGKLAELYALGAPIERATRPGGRRARCERGCRSASVRRFARVSGRRGRSEPCGARVDRAPDPAAARRRRRSRSAPTRATPASTSSPASASSSARASERSSAPGSPSRSRRDTPGFVQPRSGLAAAHGITIVEHAGPGRLRLPRRAARRCS